MNMRTIQRQLPDNGLLSEQASHRKLHSQSLQSGTAGAGAGVQQRHITQLQPATERRKTPVTGL